jgi:uncharacterized protein YegL
MQDDFFQLDFGDFSDKNIDSKKKAPICLVLDISGSMSSYGTGRMTRIDELNANVLKFLDFVRKNEKAKRISDICIITFGGTVNVVSGYTNIENIQFRPFAANGSTPMGEAMEKAVELLNLRRQYYRDNSIERYKPIMLLMSDGDPTDQYEGVASTISQMVVNKEIKLFPVGIGSDFNKQKMSKFSPLLQPKLIKNAEGFAKLFELLSASSSNPEDDQLENWFDEEF